jgi:hypothetical protein
VKHININRFDTKHVIDGSSIHAKISNLSDGTRSGGLGHIRSYGKSTWAMLALTLDIELFTQLHYRQSIDADPQLSELFKDDDGLDPSQASHALE